MKQDRIYNVLCTICKGTENEAEVQIFYTWPQQSRRPMYLLEDPQVPKFSVKLIQEILITEMGVPVCYEATMAMTAFTEDAIRRGTMDDDLTVNARRQGDRR